MTVWPKWRLSVRPQAGPQTVYAQHPLKAPRVISTVETTFQKVWKVGAPGFNGDSFPSGDGRVPWVGNVAAKRCYRELYALMCKAGQG